MEFTFEQYKKIVESFRKRGYEIKRVKDFISSESSSCLVLRHDVDRFPGQSLKMAQIEKELGVCSTYYFRIKRSVFKEHIIKEIAGMGHEIGYHYDDLSSAMGNYNKAIRLFERNLEKLRLIYPVETICMHGSPVSPWNNKDLWKKYDYKNFGIKADLFYDFDYDDVFYITDNGFGWNKFNTSVRDKVKTSYYIRIKNTQHLIELINNGKFPPKVLLNAHPDTFFEPGIRWFFNYLFIKTKNPFKRFIIKTGIIK